MYTSLILTMRKENGWHVFKKMASDIIIRILKNGHFLIPDHTLKLLIFKNWHPVGYVVFDCVFLWHAYATCLCCTKRVWEILFQESYKNKKGNVCCIYNYIRVIKYIPNKRKCLIC